MPIPDFQTVMLPLLAHLSDGREHSNQETIGCREIQQCAGAPQGQRAKKGIFITTSEFTRDANDYAAMIDSRIVLINGVRLCNLMIDHGIGVTRATSYEVKRLDSDYFRRVVPIFNCGNIKSKRLDSSGL